MLDSAIGLSMILLMADTKDRISITIDPELLKRLRHVADLREQSVSAMIERIVRNEIDSEEEFVRDMESPVMRTIMSAMVNTPGVMEGMAKIIGQSLTPEEFNEMREGLKHQKELGKKRSGDKKKHRPDGEVSSA